ncbi:MAG: ABC transporter permease subunit [Thermoanaerobaculaceae bacterium]|jgi:ABC-type transport system involved in multi-copper enzyme maturation permease subunit|nr:ABC transporter permease subunit [Thermoanaerobaculaceae bacterium]
MKVWALVVDTWREALARYTLLGFLIVSSLFLLVLTFALNLDIVDGSLAAGSLFGKAFDLHGDTPIETVVTTGESAFAAMLYGLGIFLAIFATGSQVPNLVHRGTVDLYLSRPVGRTTLLLGRFVGAVTLVLANLAFLCGGVFVIISLKTGVWNARFLLAGGLIALVFLSYLSFMYLVGVLSGSTPLSIMLPYAIYIIAMPLMAHQHIAAAMDSRLAATVVHGLYWVLPKSAEHGRDVVQLVMGKGDPSWVAMGTTLAFGAVCLGAAVAIFQRKSY